MRSFLLFCLIIFFITYLQAMENKPYHHNLDGTFRNPEGSPVRSSDIKFSYSTFSKEKKKLDLTYPSEHVVPQEKVLSDLNNLKDNNYIAWIGHATFLIKLGDTTIITDPLFSKNAGPLIFGPKRYIEPAIPLNKIPKINLFLLTHNHYDHLDYKTIKKFPHKEAKVIVPLKLSKYFTNNKFNDRKLAEETFCIIDTETTGLEVRSGDKIISFAGVKVKSFKLLDAIFDQLIDPERDVPLSSSKIHGIYQKDIVGKPKIREIEHDISNFISNCTIVGHNIQFDQDFVETIIPYSELALKFKLNPILDTFSLAISLFPDLESHELSDLCKTFKIKPEIRHTALGDSIMTANLFVILAREAQERGAKSVYDLIKIMNKSIEISKHLKKNKHY